jgi:hypothetical protein
MKKREAKAEEKKNLIKLEVIEPPTFTENYFED